jgi:hypothetical protein
LIGVDSCLCIDRDASWAIPKHILQPKAEAIDLIVPLVPNLVSMVKFKRFDLAQKVIERLWTKNRKFWLIRAPRTRQVRRHKRWRATKDWDSDSCLAEMSGRSEQCGIDATHIFTAQCRTERGGECSKKNLQTSGDINR